MSEQHPEDRRGKLNQQTFEFKSSDDGKLLIFALGKLVKTLKGEKASKLVSKIGSANSDHEIQLLLAKATGNYKRGNERTSLEAEKDGR